MTEPTHETEELQPEASDNSIREEDGEQDVAQDPEVDYSEEEL